MSSLKIGDGGENVLMDMQQPQRSLDLLAVLLPSKMEFKRPVVDGAKQGHKAPSQIPSEVAAILSLAKDKAAGPVAIYGSVSTADVAAYIKEYVAYNDEASQVVLHENDIRFVGISQLEESSKVKHLGEYDVEISIKGSEGVIGRKVVVLAEQKVEVDVQEEPKQEEQVEKQEEDVKKE
jgi:hypothetical protein